jgi:hypothetical protein
VQQPGEVGVDEVQPVIGALLGRPGVDDSRVVDKDVDLAEVLNARAEGPAPASRVTNLSAHNS